MNIKKVVIAGMMLASISCLAETSLDTSVVAIYAPLSGNPYVTFEANTLVGCHGDAGAYMPLTDDPKSQAAYSTLLAAQMANKRVRVYYSLNAANTGWSLSTISAISVTK